VLAAQFGGIIKKARLAKGLKQADLARAAMVSRTILSRLEQDEPRPVQTDVLDRIFQALEVSPQLAADSVREERRRARVEHKARLERQLHRHLRLAVELASDPKGARNRIRKAREVVALWRRNRICSPFYIKRWSLLLAQRPGELARSMTSLGEWEAALFQNTPWSWVWT
jgi:transcriptional regulator with XRE-family HTH domain